MKISFKEYLNTVEGFINPEKAEEGKSKDKNGPTARGAKGLYPKVTGISGGPGGGGEGGGGMAGGAAPAAPMTGQSQTPAAPPPKTAQV